MRERGSLWRALTLCALCTLSFAAIGCGDDDTGDGSGGSGGSEAGSGGSGGKGGKGGTGGKGGSGGSGAMTEKCVTESTALFKDMPDGLSSECIACTCDEDAAAMIACNGDANCWKLIACVNAYNCTGDSQVACASEHCGAFIAGGGKAQAIGPVLEGDKCKAKCAAADMEDAGVEDAGM